MGSSAVSSPADKVQSPPRAIAICADDYGVDQNVDRAIVDLAKQGRLTATSVLVDAAIDPASIRALEHVNIDIGLHLNFTEVLGDLPTDAVMPLNHLIVRSHAGLLSRQWVRASIERQLSRFKALFGRSPDYVDGHLHIHQLPIIRDELLQALGAQELPQGFWLRDTRAGDLSDSPWSERFKSWVVGHLGMGTLVAKAATQKIGVNQGFFGVYDFTAEHRPFMQMMAGWLVKANSGALVMTHPSCEALRGDPIGQARVLEYQALGSEAFGELLKTKAVTLARPTQLFSSLP
jgi:chitin disaccharide deacetylase